MAIVPPARGGRAIPIKPKAPPKPKAPRVIRPKLIDPNTQAQQNAMSAFRTALAQLNTATPPVNEAAIRAPYAQSEAITGQLGQGLQQAVLGSGQAAQAQYGQALGQAQQQAAQFGISAGAGANPTALQNTGAQPLAQQTNAYAAAAPMAATQWQQLLERTAGAKVADAQAARDQGLVSARQSLATALPGAIQNEEQLGFQQHTQRFNEGLARTQLTTKQNADMRNYGLDVAKVQSSAQASAARTKSSAVTAAASLAERKRHDLASEATTAASVALRARAKQASAKGLKGVPAAVKALSGTSSGASTKKVAKGWDVQVVALDPDTGEPTGTAQTMTVPDKRFAPKGFQIVKGASAVTHYETTPSKTGKTGITASQWDQQMRGLLAQNPGQAKAIKAFLGPRPKK